MANQKITQLTALTTPALVDLLAVVDDPSGTPVTKKIEIATLLGELTGGWQDYALTLTYASATTFTIGADVTKTFRPGRAISLVQTTTKYFYVVSSTYSAPNTTVTVTGGSDYTLVNAAISSVKIGMVAIPYAFPQWFNYTPTITAASGAFTTVTASGKFAMSGKTVHFKILVVVTDKGTAAGYVNATLPVAPFGAYREAMAGVSMVTATGNLYSDLVCYIATNILRIYDGAGGNPAVNGNSLIITGTYEAA